MRALAWALVLSIVGIAAPEPVSAQDSSTFAIGGVGGSATDGPTVFLALRSGWGVYGEWREGTSPDAGVRSRYSVAAVRYLTRRFGVYAGGGVHVTTDGGWGVHPVWGIAFRPHPDVVIQLAGEDGKGGSGLGLAFGPPVYAAIWRAITQPAPDITSVRIGMAAGEVRRVLGSPRRVRTFESAAGRSEAWEYRDGVFIYFHDGVVTGVQRVDVR